MSDKNKKDKNEQPLPNAKVVYDPKWYEDEDKDKNKKKKGNNVSN